MYILAIETTGPHCSAAIIDEDGKIVSIRSEERLNHLKILTPMINSLIKENNLTMDQIDAVAASEGPGSFTGIRIGVSTARAISQIKTIPCIAVPTLYAFSQGQEISEEDILVCAILDARRKQVYGDGCINKEEVIKGAPFIIGEFMEEVLKVYKEKNLKQVVFVGDGVKTCGEDILAFAEANNINVELHEIYQYAEGVAKIALEMYKKGQTVDYNHFEPNYMRKAEAQRKLEERLAMNK